VITRKKNDFVYYEPSKYVNYPYSTEQTPAKLIFAGGTVRVPVWLLWSTWALIGALIFVIETLVGWANETLATEGLWGVSLSYLLLTVAFFVIYWPIYWVAFIVRTWVGIIRGAL
jgi:hypothetical protein